MNGTPEFLERLYRRTAHGIKLGLETELALLGVLGDPHRHGAYIHVAGTNGKGSVCALIESIVRAAGVRTGLYTSPHLVRFHERIRVDGAPISDEELSALLEIVEEADRTQSSRPGGREATFFEFATALAFEHFRRRGVELVVLETGMGGRCDATNVVTPAVSVITRIGLDHQRYLGTTVEAIAKEKAGIIKPGVPVVCAAMPREARDVIWAVAQDRKAPFIEVEHVVRVRARRGDARGQELIIETPSDTYGPVLCPLLGPFQVENVAAAVAAVEAWGFPGCDAQAICDGIARVRWPGRLQRIREEPPIWLDVAHNPDAARALCAGLKSLLGGRPLALVVGLLEDKDAEGFARALAPLAKACWAVEIRHERAMPGPQLEARLRAGGLPARLSTLEQAITEAEQWAKSSNGAICVTGSFYLAGEFLAHLGITDVDALGAGVTHGQK